MRIGIDPRRAVMWIAVLVASTLLMLYFRHELNKAHVALAYLIVVQGASAHGGRTLGLTMAGFAFLTFNWFFLPPYGTLVIQDPLDWTILIAFLVTSVVSAHLLYRAQSEALVANDRAVEIDKLASLGAETLNAGRAEDALIAIVSVIRSTLVLDDCSVFSANEAGEVGLAARASVSGQEPPPEHAVQLARWVARNGNAAAEQLDGTTRIDATPIAAPEEGPGSEVRAIQRPLNVRGLTVGVLRVSRERGLSFTGSQSRVLDALSYYAALGLERVRLVAEEERAKALDDAHRAKDAVLASVSHDLRTPLTTIKALAHEIAENGDERANIIEQEADRLNAFVGSLLDLSRLASGAATDRIDVNDIEDLVGAAVQQAGGLLAGRDLRIDMGEASAGILARFDFAQSLRALVNLLENAAKYSPHSSPIEVRVALDAETVSISVADRGPGVPAEERDRIFEPFYRPARAAPDAGGVGLGLSIAKGIARAQGGSLTYADRDGGGSVFTFRIPTSENDS